MAPTTHPDTDRSDLPRTGTADPAGTTDPAGTADPAGTDLARTGTDTADTVHSPVPGSPDGAPTRVVPAGADRSAPAPRRTVSVRIASLVATLAFLLGAGAALLVGGVAGPGVGGPPAGGPGGPGGVGGPGAAATTSQGTTTTGTAA